MSSPPALLLSPVDDGHQFSPFSPSADTNYSSDDGDIVQTPFTEHAEVTLHFISQQDSNYGFQSSERYILQDNHENNPDAGSGLKIVDGIYCPVPSVPNLLLSTFMDQDRTESYPPSSFSSSMLDTGSRLEDNRNTEMQYSSNPNEMDPFDAAFAAANDERVVRAPLITQGSFNINEGIRYSARFPVGHILNEHFLRTFDLGEDIGSGGYGFVMTAINRELCEEVAVKFIIKDKVSEHAWMTDEVFGRLPTEIMLLSLIDHENIVKCLDLFEDELYFYLVQELHGSPWKKVQEQLSSLYTAGSTGNRYGDLPGLSFSASEDSIVDPNLVTPLHSFEHLNILRLANQTDIYSSKALPPDIRNQKSADCQDGFLKPPHGPMAPPKYARRPSHDLFECIEQTPHKRLSEESARYVFAQVVEAVYYLDCQGITHRDIKDENLVIDRDFTVKLIDFGSATIADPTKPRPYHNLFFGTTAYASSEILRKQPYQAPPAEMWTLGVLLSYLLTGMSPFPTEKDAINGRIVIAEIPGRPFSRACLDLLRMCLEPDPGRRANIREVRAHRWLKDASEIFAGIRE